MATPRHQPTDKDRGRVQALAGYGIPEDQIARDLDICPKTLRKYYRDELDTAHTKANAQVAQSLFQKAVGNGPQSVTACIFWLKTRMGWKEPATAFEHSGPNGGAIPQEITTVEHVIVPAAESAGDAADTDTQDIRTAH